MYVYIYTYLGVCVYIYTYICMYIYIYIYIYPHTHTHVCTNTTQEEPTLMTSKSAVMSEEVPNCNESQPRSILSRGRKRDTWMPSPGLSFADDDDYHDIPFIRWVCCSVLQCVAVCCIVLQCLAVFDSVW